MTRTRMVLAGTLIALWTVPGLLYAGTPPGGPPPRGFESVTP
jgi:hypothetical protein